MSHVETHLKLVLLRLPGERFSAHAGKRRTGLTLDVLCCAVLSRAVLCLVTFAINAVAACNN